MRHRDVLEDIHRWEAKVNSDVEVVLNAFAQGRISREQTTAWFERINDQGRLPVLQKLVFMISQADAESGDYPIAFKKSGLKQTHTPAVIASKEISRQSLSKIINLPSRESGKSFSLLIELLSVADSRRRIACGEYCKHWWHNEISDEAIVNALSGSE